MEKLTLEKLTLVWLNGGDTNMDGGAMFGVVPKPLWSKKYDYNEKNQVELRTDPIYIKYNGKHFLIDSGVGAGRLTEKQIRNYGVQEESKVEESLQQLGVKPEEIDYVFMTHMHFDHACGLTKMEEGQLVSTFPNAKIITTATEWNEMRNPNIRSKATYWEDNWKAIKNQVEVFEQEWKHGPFTLIHTGGHSDGHALILIEDGEQVCLHLGDILPTSAHQNVLWVTAYDDYPMTSIEQKQKWISFAMEKQAWFTFYHDSQYRALKWNSAGEITASIKRKN